MACTTEFIESVCETLAPLGEVRARKMMGEYVIYVNENRTVWGTTGVLSLCINR